MPFKKGEKRPPGAGRKKGTLNRSTEHIFKLCEEKGFDPISALIELASSTEWGDNRLAALKELCQYMYPRRKAIEHSEDPNNPFMGKSLEELKELVKEKLK